MTTVESPQMSSKPLHRHRLILAALFGIFLFVRVIAMTADPPAGLSWSAGIFSDEGIYAVDARSVVLTGHWAPGDFHSAIIAPLFHLMQLCVFRSIGVGLAQARWISVVCSLGTLTVFYRALCVRYDQRTARVAVVFLGLSVPFVLYNRLALLETPVVFVLVAAYAARIRTGNRALTGLLLGIAFAIKPLALLAAPGFVIADWPDRRAALKLVAGLGVALVTYVLVWYVPHQTTLARMNHYYAVHQYLAHSGSGIAHNLKRGLWTGDGDGVFPYLVRHEPILTILAGWSLIRHREQWKQDRLLIAWLLVPLFLFLLVSYTPSRYLVLIWPPLAALAARSLAHFDRNAVRSAVCLFALCSLAQFLMLWPQRAFTVFENGKRLPQILSGETRVAGQFAPELCLSNRLTCIYVQPGLANAGRFPGAENRAAVLVTRSADWDPWWRRHAPQLFARQPRQSLEIGRKFVVDIYSSP